ncbi:MAG: hypothetical protein DMD29_06200 [Gemmatimonadetes bacterium]|nr:MAG: hypothetical protein DMD29_06200 [Gemmatimonadota bacterium]
MQRFIVVLGLALLAATSVQAQRGSWQSEIGIQGGFSRFKPSGSGAKDHVDLFDVPGFSLSPLNHSYGAIFAIIPWRDKIAIEPTVSTAELSVGGTTFSLATLGVRADYALTPKVYAAAGGTLGYVDAGGQHESQLGIQAAVGYRLHLASGMNGRVEANWQTTKKANLIGPANVYSLLFGVSARAGGAAAARPARSTSAWDRVIGVQGGYSHIHAIGSGAGDITILSFPGWGGGLTTSILGPVVLSVAPTMFAIFPAGQKLAVEPGIDIHRIQSQGTTAFTANVSARLDYAVSGGWYAAAGGNLVYTKATPGSGYFNDPAKGSVSQPGLNLAWGYHFHLAGAFGGRVEANYVMLKQNKDLGLATNTFGLMFGATMPLR